jgi:pyruvate,water dikinase
VPARLARAILEEYDALCQVSGHGRVAVRSSGAEEDSQSASFAGQFSSFLNLDAAALLETVKRCWASYLSARSLAYRAATGISFRAGPTFGLIVQVQVFPQKAGVLFTVHPLHPDGAVGCIEANFGTGESVVGGLATPDTAIMSRSDADVVEVMTAAKRRMTVVSPGSLGSHIVEVADSQRRAAVLTNDEMREIFQMGLRIEELMGRAQDIEWAWDSQLLILQARPVTGMYSGTF